MSPDLQDSAQTAPMPFVTFLFRYFLDCYSVNIEKLIIELCGHWILRWLCKLWNTSTICSFLLSCSFYTMKNIRGTGNQTLGSGCHRTASCTESKMPIDFDPS